MKTVSTFSKKISSQKFIQCGLHLGGLKSFLLPNIKPYLSSYRDDFCIFHLNLSVVLLKRCLNLLSKLILKGKIIVFIGSPFGMEKEFSLLCKNFGHIHFDSWQYGCVTNQEKFFKTLKKPALFFLFNPNSNKEALSEILTLNVPVMAFLNSNDSVYGIDYCVPGNICSWKGSLFIYNFFRYLFLYTSKN